jgi:hypothetical protein
MGKYVDITGTRFGKLVAIRGIGNGALGKWVFKCDCGNTKEILKQNVVQGKSRSCGCQGPEENRKRCRMNREEFRGKKFDRLRVLDVTYDGRITWCRCVCDCGKIVKVRGGYLRSCHTNSCGCNRAFRLPKGEAGLSVLYNHRYKARARRAGLPFSVDRDTFRKLVKKSCYYCGRLPSRVAKTVSKHSRFVYNGLDRVDSSKGYTLDNVVTCCRDCNIMKMDKSQDAFLNKIRRVHRHMFNSSYLNIAEDLMKIGKKRGDEKVLAQFKAFVEGLKK